MAKGKAKQSDGNDTVAVNRKARHDYHIEDTFEAGLSLQGWEVKSLRAGRMNIAESYVTLRGGNAWLQGCHVSPLQTASTHVETNPTRHRQLLLNRHELNKLIGAVERRGYTVVPLRAYFTRGLAKLQIGLAKGKRQVDKREDMKERDWQREKARDFKLKR